MFFYVSKPMHCMQTMFHTCILFASLVFSSSYAQAGDLSTVSIDTKQAVIYGSCTPHMQSDKLLTALQQGSSITFTWNIIIEEVSPYWLNHEVGSVQLTRQATADLVSQQWLLKDSNTGITRSTLSAQSAVHFLAELKDFPIIDKSLLEKGVDYRIKINLHIEEGQINEGWWSQLLQFSDTVGIGGFILP